MLHDVPWNKILGQNEVGAMLWNKYSSLNTLNKAAFVGKLGSEGVAALLVFGCHEYQH